MDAIAALVWRYTRERSLVSRIADMSCGLKGQTSMQQKHRKAMQKEQASGYNIAKLARQANTGRGRAGLPRVAALLARGRGYRGCTVVIRHVKEIVHVDVINSVCLVYPAPLRAHARSGRPAPRDPTVPGLTPAPDPPPRTCRWR